MPKIRGSDVTQPTTNAKRTVDFTLEELVGYIESDRKHIRQAIIDAGREEVPNPLEQFTELLNAATNLANTTSSTEAKTADYTTIGLQLLSKMLGTPEIRDKIIDVLKAFQPKSQKT